MLGLCTWEIKVQWQHQYQAVAMRKGKLLTIKNVKTHKTIIFYWGRMHSKVPGHNISLFHRYLLSGDYYAYIYVILFIKTFVPSHLYLLSQTMYVAEWCQIDEIIGTISVAFKSQIYPKSSLEIPKAVLKHIPTYIGTTKDIWFFTFTAK